MGSFPSEARSAEKIALCKGIRIPESGKVLFVEYEILGFEIWNTAQGIQNPTKDRIPLKKKSGIQYLEPGIHGLESRIQSCLW